MLQQANCSWTLTVIIIAINISNCPRFSLNAAPSSIKKRPERDACVQPLAITKTWTCSASLKWEMFSLEIIRLCKTWLRKRTWKPEDGSEENHKWVEQYNLLSSRFTSHGIGVLLLSSIIPTSKCATCFVFMIFPPPLRFCFRNNQFCSFSLGASFARSALSSTSASLALNGN